MSTDLVVYQKPDQVRSEIADLAPALAEVLPAGMDATRFVRVVVRAIIGNPKLMECTRASLLGAVHEAAQLGLEPTGLLGSAYLVPYNRRFEQGGRWHTVTEAKLIPGYRGLIDLARRSGQIEAVIALPWRLKDTFDYEPTRQPHPIVHRPFIPNPTDPPEARDRGAIVGFYMVATLKGGHEVPEVMTFDEVEEVRKSSKAADKGPWITNYSEMGRKTVARRGLKWLPLTTDLQRALELDEEAERDAAPPVAVSASVPRAAQMLLDRATARETGQHASEAPGVVEVPAEGDSEAHGAADGLPETPAADPATGEVLPPTNVAAEQEHDGAPPTAREVCGVDGGMLGFCSRAPGHPGGHQSAQGKWARDKGDPR